MSTGDARDVLAALEALAPVVARDAERAESIGALTEDVAAGLRGSGALGMWTPREVDGLELGAVDGIAVLEAASYLDGSFGWVILAQAGAAAAAGAYLGNEAAASIFADGVPPISGHGLPNGRAVRVDAGYVVTGAWSYASGIRNADFVLAGAAVYEDAVPVVDANGERDIRLFYVPRDAVSLADNWDVIGLRGTGSIDYTIDEVFVGDDFGHLLHTNAPRRGGPLYLLGLHGLALLGHAGWALGVGRRMLDELATLARRREGRFAADGGGGSLHERFAEADGTLLAARAFAYDVARMAEAAVARGAPPSTDELTRMKLMCNRVTFAVADVARFAYTAAGGAGLRAGVIQRSLRDLLASTQHAIVAPTMLASCGLVRLGLADGKVWNGHALVDPTAQTTMQTPAPSDGRQTGRVRA